MEARIRRHQPPLPGQSRTVRFDGRELNGPVSMFLVDTESGGSSPQHSHPYAETWVVSAGEVEFTVGDRTHRATAGDIVVAPAHVPHRFVNPGPERLRLVCIHASDLICQDDL